jgi:hypothetical protein
MAVSLTGCQSVPKETSLSLAIKNETEYEMQEVLFVGENYGRGNPWVYLPIVTAEEKPLSAGEERKVTISVSEKMFNIPWYAEITASEAVRRYDRLPLELNKDVEGFVITYGLETDFVFTPVYPQQPSQTKN